jgi:hypothetical protein
MDDEECETMRRLLEQECKALCTIEHTSSISDWLSNHAHSTEDADVDVLNGCGFEDTKTLLPLTTKGFAAALDVRGVEQACKERLVRAFADLQAKRCFLVPAALKSGARNEARNQQARKTMQLGRCYR